MGRQFEHVTPVQAMKKVTTFSVSTTTKIIIPSTSLVLTPVMMTLPSCENKTHFDFTPMQENSAIGSNCIIYPLDYATIRGGLQRGLQALVNLGQQEIKLQHGTVLGHLQ